MSLPGPAAAPVPVPGPGAAPVGDPPDWDEDVEVSAGAVRLAGQLAVPDQASGIVVFAHGSGSSRHSPRNRYVAAVLNQAALGTLLFDLLTPDEEAYCRRTGSLAQLGTDGRADESQGPA